MTHISDIVNHFEQFAPSTLAESWDNVGLLLGRKQSEVKQVMTCLTLSPDVAAEAIEKNVDLIISHHPILFRPVQQIVDSSAEGTMLLDLIESRIAVFSPHTRYDSAETGINQQLAELLSLEQIEPIRPLNSIEESSATKNPLGSGRWGKLPQPMSLQQISELVKQKLNVPALATVGAAEMQISSVGIACGSAGDFLSDAAKLGCEAFITGEARFHTAFEAREQNIGLILAGHYQTERPAMENLAEVLQKRFPNLTVSASQTEADPFNWM